MFTNLVQKNKKNISLPENANVVRILCENYASGLSVLVKTFEKSKYFWHILSDWSRVWYPVKVPCDIIVFKEFEDGKVQTEFHGIPDNFQWIGDKKILHFDPDDHKYILRIYKCQVDKPALVPYISANQTNLTIETQLVSSLLVTENTSSPLELFKETVKHYSNYHQPPGGPPSDHESTLDNFWYVVWDTACCSLVANTPTTVVLTSQSINLLEQEQRYCELFKLRHRTRTMDRIKIELPFLDSKTLENETEHRLENYWKNIMSKETKKHEYIEYLKDEEEKYFKFYDSFSSQSIILRTNVAASTIKKKA